MYVITVLGFTQGPFNNRDHRLAVNGFSKESHGAHLFGFTSGLVVVIHHKYTINVWHTGIVHLSENGHNTILVVYRRGRIVMLCRRFTLAAGAVDTEDQPLYIVTLLELDPYV